MFKPKTPFDTVYIISQILAYQFVFYTTSTLMILVFDFLSGIPFNSQQIFNFSIYGFKTSIGRAAIVGQLSGGLGAAIAFSLVEGRSKKALDFITTVYGIHIAITSILYKFPTSFSWWVMSFVFWALSTILAEFTSMKIEMQPINLDEMRK